MQISYMNYGGDGYKSGKKVVSNMRTRENKRELERNQYSLFNPQINSFLILNPSLIGF